MTIVFVFKNGFKLETKCKDFTTTRNNFGDVVGVNAKGITKNKFIHIDFSEVICIYRIVSDEEDEQ